MQRHLLGSGGSCDRNCCLEEVGHRQGQTRVRLGGCNSDRKHCGHKLDFFAVQPRSRAG